MVQIVTGKCLDALGICACDGPRDWNNRQRAS
jgi:hypothetical protein